MLLHFLSSLSLFFFFSSRRRHTRSTRDWSSDVCSSDLEEVVLRASARVQRQTGAAMVVHPDASHRSYEQIARTLDLLESEGALLHKVIVSHADERLHTRPEDYSRLARRGCILAFDTFGRQYYYPRRRRQYPSDQQRIELLARLEREGLAGQIVLSH